MKVRSNRKELADALTWVAGALDKRTGVPALAGIRLSAADDVLTAAPPVEDVSIFDEVLA